MNKQQDKIPVLRATKEMKICLMYNYMASSYYFAYVLCMHLSIMFILHILHMLICFLVLSRTDSIVCSENGLYPFLGHIHGLLIISTSTHTCVRTWQDERVELTSVSCASLGNATHLSCTVDDMGNFMRVFFFSDNLH